MSTVASRPAEQPVRPFRREVVASFSSYLEARRAIDNLAALGFPVERVNVVGQGLQIVTGEAPRRRWLSLLEAALAGAVVGAFAMLLGVVTDLGGAALSAAWIGSGLFCGTLGGVSVDVLWSARRGPGPELRLFADRYDLAVDPGIADEAVAAIEAAEEAAESRWHETSPQDPETPPEKDQRPLKAS
jgi:hypothetical protein